MIVVLVMFIIVPTHPFAESGNSELNEIDIATSPQKVLFNTDNLKPGDTITRNLIIKNDGLKDFNYLFSSKFSAGSKKFYNSLLLSVKKDGMVLFHGNLKDFEELKPRFLPNGSTETLTFKLEMPYELGNEYQGLMTEVIFKFFAKGEDADKSDPTNPSNPSDPATPPNNSGIDIPVFSGGLPQTGESLPTLFYLIGGLLIATGTALYASQHLKRRRG
ncbi:TasA family protein [Thalassobacillus pellis]|uniref:TasA family protein n=1 Tax=Thalassobacillus pellis TaxID=748008 RepID=UPI00195F8460|nr:TasA family protein [Thalassobacillus pellis]MBM7553665.1 LPXTG-motif cell wall-anchored protein [Thalassobacillus pellis]